MKTTTAVLALASGLMVYSGSALAFDTWTGEKTFVDFRDYRITSLVVEMNEKHQTASVADTWAAGHGTFTTTKEELKITFKTPMESFGYPTVLNPYTGNIEQVPTTVLVKELTITGESEGAYTVKSAGETCHAFYVPGEGVREDCKDLEDNYEDAYFKKLEGSRPVQTKISVGDKIALPLEGMNSTYVEILEEGKVKNLLPESDITPIESLKRVEDKLVAKLQNGESITYSRLAQSNGSELLLAVKRDSSNNLLKMTTGTIFVDENVNTMAIDFTGTYNVVGFGSSYFGGDEFLINFMEDGYGGFEYYYALDDETSETVWKWEATSTGMKAQRFMKFDEFDNFIGMANTKEEIETCLQEEKSCRVFQEREYQILGKDGNKLIMLRRLESKLNTEDEKNVGYSINYLYKK